MYRYNKQERLSSNFKFDLQRNRVVDLKLELCEQVFFPRYKKVTATFYDKRFSEEIMLEFYVNQVEICLKEYLMF